LLSLLFVIRRGRLIKTFTLLGGSGKSPFSP